MVRLRNRQQQVPGGLLFKQPQTKFQTIPYSSFRTIVDAVVAHRRANLAISKQYGLSLDPEEIAKEVDVYNALRCQSHGWTQYIIEDNTVNVPKTQARSIPSTVASVVAGAKVISEMFGPGGPIRDSNLATKRAAVCVVCPKNEKGDWSSWFTIPAQLAIRKILAYVKDLDLSTPYDDQLRVCSACHCPMRAKVWSKLEYILAHIQPEAKADLDPNCWILKEEEDAKKLLPI